MYIRRKDKNVTLTEKKLNVITVSVTLSFVFKKKGQFVQR